MQRVYSAIKSAIAERSISHWTRSACVSGGLCMAPSLGRQPRAAVISVPGVLVADPARSVLGKARVCTLDAEAEGLDQSRHHLIEGADDNQLDRFFTRERAAHERKCLG